MLLCFCYGLKITFAVAINSSLSVTAADTAINALHRVLAKPQAVLQDIHHDLELTEDQNLQARCPVLTPAMRP